MNIATKFANAKAQIRKVWALSLPFFQSEEKWKARGLLAAIVLLNLAAVYMLVELNDWRRVFYDALQNKDQKVFWQELWHFCYIATAYIVIAVYQTYLTQMLDIRWRRWMTHYYLKRWLSKNAFYSLELERFSGKTVPDNPDQRIQEDLDRFTQQTISLSMGLLNAVVTLGSFVGILWSLSGGFDFHFGGSEYSIPGFMVWMAVLYSLAGSFITHRIGRPLIGLNFQQQRVEADFRHHLLRVREHSEAIALDRGAPIEREHLGQRFGRVMGNTLQLMKAQKRLNWFTVGFGQAAAVFPFIVAAPRFFSGAIQLGQLMQISEAFGQVQGSLSWFVDSYAALASWHATTDRLTSFEAALQEKLAAAQTQATDTSDHLKAEHLTLQLPDGQTVIENENLSIQPGEALLLQGPSGSGKSTLFRAFAGIWPHSTGQIGMPDQAMFIAQRPYFPLGSLRDALAYPEPASAYSDEQLKEALRQALLPQLQDQLDVESSWSQQLSGGEQQRLAVARVFLKKPAWVFADEATSALDEAAETTVYERLRSLVRDRAGALVSIAHRPGVAQFHDRRWSLVAAPDGASARYTVAQS